MSKIFVITSDEMAYEDFVTKYKASPLMFKYLEDVDTARGVDNAFYIIYKAYPPNYADIYNQLIEKYGWQELQIMEKSNARI